MLTLAQLHPYQKKAVNHQCVHPNSMLWLDMGLGKTVITLATIEYLQRTGWLGSVLIIAPLRVCRLVWRQEATKWAELKGLTFSMVMGTPDQRTRALLRPANIYLINYENLGWISEALATYFVRKNKPIPFDGVVFDEVSKMKNSTTNRVKSFKKIFPALKWTTGLTGTPASNGYKDLHGQYLVIDGGQRLGTSKTAFRTRFYFKQGFKEIPFHDTEAQIKTLIYDITLEMSAEDYLAMPDLIVNDVVVELPENVRSMYDKMEKEFFIKLDSGSEVEMFNQASLTNKLLQFSNGAVYPVAGMPLWEAIHDEKLDALDEIIEESAGKPVLCAYAYRSDAERIMERFKDLRPINLTTCKSESALQEAMSRWWSGECQLMICHPACLDGDTQVLTERNGWTRLVDVGLTDRVFDGVEFVSHQGCCYSGFKEVINVMGITMTPDHKLLIDGKWTEAENVQDTEKVRQEAQNLQRQIDDRRTSPVPNVWSNFGNNLSERGQKQQGTTGALFRVHTDYFSSTYKHPPLAYMEGDENAMRRYVGQKLWWSWGKCLSGVVKFYQVLERHVSNVCRRFDHRTDRREQTLLQGELQMGYEYGTASKQAEQQNCLVPRSSNSFSRVSQAVRIQQNNVDDETQSRDDWRRSCGELQELRLRQEPEIGEHWAARKAHVYDLINCGPRSRFVIRNSLGEVFVSHNSAGHGIDGLQKTGNVIVWYGLNWSLDLYLQMNARLHRQGQGQPVICHRIICKNTMDDAQSIALDEKATTQSGLRKAVKEYREKREKSA